MNSFGEQLHFIIGSRIMGLALCTAAFNPIEPGHGEGIFVGVHLVVTAVEDSNFDINDRISGQSAGFASGFNALFNGGDIIARK